MARESRNPGTPEPRNLGTPEPRNPGTLADTKLYSCLVLVSDFDFDLPEALIAQEPAPRGGSRLMVLDRTSGAVQHTTISALPSLLRAGDVLLVNNTRVFAARLLGH